MIHLNVVTPCSRPENLQLLSKSIDVAQEGLPLKIDWYISFDLTSVFEDNIELPSLAEGSIHALYINNNHSRFGNAQRNEALDLIEHGFVCFLDDDNLVHPKYFRMICDIHDQHEYQKGIVCNQFDNDFNARSVGLKYCKPGAIDAAQYIIPRSFIGKNKWPLSSYAADGMFIKQVTETYGNQIVFVDEVNCYYNAIDLDLHGEMVLKVGDLVTVNKEYLSHLRTLPNKQTRRTLPMLGRLVDEELDVGLITEDERCANVIPLNSKHPKFNKGRGVNVVFSDPKHLRKAFAASQLFGSEFNFERKICFGPQWESETHRSGWKYAINALRCLHHRDQTILDGFVENSFSWDRDISLSAGITPYFSPWVGFIHNPPKMPDWFGDGHSSNQQIFSQKEWKLSLPKCKGLFTLSKYHRDHLKTIYPDLPINYLYHPTETPEVKFNYSHFLGNPDRMLIQVGWWLRKPFSLHQVQVENYAKCSLGTGNPWQHLMKTYQELPKDVNLKSVTQLMFQSNDDYDQLLSQNLVFIDLYDSSANNAIIECIVRNTPILVNKLPPVVEYLGDDYPLYFRSLEEAGEKADNFDLVLSAHEYLKQMTKEQYSKEHFLKSFVASEIYQSL